MVLSLKVKLCGFSEKETIDFASQFNIDFMGFIFCPDSPRNIDLKNIAQITKNIPKNIKKVAVIVDESNEKIQQIINELKPDFLQLHGSENVSRVLEIKKLFKIPIIKAFRISTKDDLNQITDFEDVADYFLFDAKVTGYKGGSGQKFDWNILKDLKTQKEWFLSGGVNQNNLAEITQNFNIKMIDLSSAIEEVRGIKSKKLIKEFMNKISLLSKASGSLK